MAYLVRIITIFAISAGFTQLLSSLSTATTIDDHKIALLSSPKDIPPALHSLIRVALDKSGERYAVVSGSEFYRVNWRNGRDDCISHFIANAPWDSALHPGCWISDVPQVANEARKDGWSHCADSIREASAIWSSDDLIITRRPFNWGTIFFSYIAFGAIIISLYTVQGHTQNTANQAGETTSDPGKPDE